MQVQAVSQAVVTERKSLGRVPADQFVKSRPFIPDRAGLNTENTEDTREVTAEVPQRTADGDLVIRDQRVTLEDDPYNPAQHGATSAVMGFLAAGLTAAAKSGQGFNLKAAAVGCVAAGVAGVLTVLNDEVKLVHKDQVVNEPVLNGYTTYATPASRGHGWTAENGTQFVFVEKLDKRPVGSVKVATLEHSSSDLARFGLPLISSLAAGLLLG